MSVRHIAYFLLGDRRDTTQCLVLYRIMPVYGEGHQYAGIDE